MFPTNIIPALPLNAQTESNRETLIRLNDDLAGAENQIISATDEYRMYVGADDYIEHPFWGYCVETAQVDDTKEIFVLMRSNEGHADDSKELRWLPMSKVLTRKIAHLRYKVVGSSGPSEAVMFEMLKLLREAFEFAVEDNWSYRERLEFYHAFPFHKLVTVDAIQAFRPVLLDSPAFANDEGALPSLE